ncbi:hypothetical protein CVIRNUC_010734 [Coccomyxa viridis]|uniref:Porin n=1 Tax=Coccomyxa viridis TaxID=1274662 RepID=A0AAV1IJK0_9CHLO|nr:hypothetical protein CVIRNUC_010734 [Coccomyxa viridis]
MSGPVISAKGFFVGQDLARHQNRAAGASKVGGRVDVTKDINEIRLTGSVTDATARDYEAAPWVRDFIVTAEKRLNANSTGMVGYDFGAQSAFVSVGADTELSGKEVQASATWFQAGQQVRTQASARLEPRATLWGTHTFHDESLLSNSTYVNLRERQGFIIHPFTVPISTSAAQLSLEHDGYLIEPAFDFKQRAGYISVAKDHRNKYALRGSYAFREETALFEVGYKNHSLFERNPLIKGYVKAPLSARNGIGALSLGLIVDHTFEI